MTKLSLTYSELKVLSTVLINYIDHLCYGIEHGRLDAATKEKYNVYMSVATDLHVWSKKKQEDRYPQQKYSKRLATHDALVLRRALLHFTLNCSDVFQTAVMDSLKNWLDQKIISNT